MEAVAAPAARRGAERGRRLEVVGLALLAYVPFLLSSPGKVSADTKTYLYLDPGRLLSRAPYLWDPHVGFGTVPHQQIGYLFPMGPFFWLTHEVGIPDWVAQRVWLGTISFAAVLGARWLFTMLGVRRFGALAGALVYLLTPYQLAFTARISVILLAWAALPWLVGLTMRAVSDGGWRDPALFALVALAAGSVNASSLLLVLIAPGLWLVLHACGGREAFGASLRAAGRIALLGLGVSLWTIVGLREQGAYGLPVLQLTETLQTVARSSSPTDLLRGIGNWYFYGTDRFGYSIDQASDYLHSDLVVFATFAIPVLALAAAGALRWRHRAYFAVLVVVGTVVGVGAFPYANSTPYGALFKIFANDTSAGLALRNTPRVVPVVVLGLAGLLAAGVGALSSHRQQLVAAGVVVALALVAFLPVWRFGYLSGGVSRDENIPQYWTDAAAALQRGGDATRVLEIPGSSFAAYRWGDTIEPITPGLIDRPYVAREQLPAGTPPSVELLQALDHRLQEGTFEPQSLAPYARLTGVGTISLRSDLQYERFDTPRPRTLWALLTQPLATGLRAPQEFGRGVPNRASNQLPMLDDIELRTPVDAADPPAVALFDVVDPVPIVHSAPSAQPVVLSGDGEGIVDAAAAGLIDGNQLVLESAALDDVELTRALHAGADLVLTDSNRRRSQHYFSRIRDTTGYTERAGQTARHDDDTFRLEPFPGTGDDARTVVEQHGGQVGATDYATSADRPANAFDGDPRTAWRVGGRAVGDRIVIHPDQPVQTDHVTLAQLPGVLGRSISEVRLHFDGGDTLEVALGPASRTAAGQTVTFPERTVRSLAVEIRGVRIPDVDPLPREVGFTEIGLGDVRVRETVRLPVELSHRVGAGADGHRLDVVLSRQRYDPGELQDEELALDRRFVLPDARTFGVSGTARIDPNAPDAVLDDLLGTTAPGTVYTSSDHLAGDLDARASRAFDGDPSTAWSPNFGPQRGRWIDVTLPAPVTVDHIDLTVVADRRHSVPTQFTLAADGVPLRTFTIEPPARGKPGTTRTVSVPFDPVTGKQFRLYVDAVEPKMTTVLRHQPKVEAPVAIAEVGLAGVPTPAAAATVSTACRADLLAVNGAPVPIRVVGDASDARSGLAIDPCGIVPSVALPRGSNTLRSTAGLDTGIDIDRVVLSSGTDGRAAPPAVLGTPLDQSGASVRVVGSTPDSYDLRVRTDGKPFWLVLGESADDGWEATTSSGAVGSRQVVNGFANGWLVTPRGAGTLTMELRWTPQRAVWLGIAVSVLAVLACLAIIVVATRRRRGRASPAGAALADPPAMWSPFAYPGAPPSTGILVVLAIGAAVGTSLFSRPWIGFVVGVATLVAARVAGGRILLTAGAPVALAMARIARFDDLAWLAIALLALDVVTWWVRERPRRRATAATTPASE
ncbi:MAG TPA: alpha-(1-_3)-arabinofuranosyltransferase family protein [Acidimicrobiia bacterium]|nr:alpha-(1->3)-arabinofuranosyltransferase family protein [Acidimicrobiia bacterium]